MLIKNEDNCNLAEYFKTYRKLIKKRCELDARIDFITDLITGYAQTNDFTCELVFYDQNGKVVRKELAQ